MNRPLQFWEQLNETERGVLIAQGRSTRFESGSVLLSQGQASPSAIILRSGVARVITVSEDGRSTLLGRRTAGDLLGEQSGLDGGTCSATVTADGLVTGLAIVWREFTRLMAEHPGVSRAVIRTLSGRLRESDLSRVRLSRPGVAARVAGALLDEMSRAGKGATPDVCGMSQGDLGSTVGASRESVSRALNSLRALGAVDTGRKRITVTDIEVLRREANRQTTRDSD